MRLIGISRSLLRRIPFMKNATRVRHVLLHLLASVGVYLLSYTDVRVCVGRSNLRRLHRVNAARSILTHVLLIALLLRVHRLRRDNLLSWLLLVHILMNIVG